MIDGPAKRTAREALARTPPSGRHWPGRPRRFDSDEPGERAMTASSTDTRLDDHETEVPPMIAVYRHDVHKLRGRSHEAADDEVAGVRVNETVPRNADRDAALLSRPPDEPEQTMGNHLSPTRLSLRTGEPVTTGLPTLGAPKTRALVTPTDPEQLHAEWLTSSVAAGYNESIYYPYTSLKYHTLLTAALLSNYRAGYAFEECWLVATSSPEDDDNRTAMAAQESADVTPYRTVLWTPVMALHVTGEPAGRPATRLAGEPSRSFADVWAQLPEHPLDTDGERRWRLLDAQLRRIRSWSVALQYIEEVVDTWGTEAGAGSESGARTQRPRTPTHHIAGDGCGGDPR
ncbi:hypothetical protein ACLI4Q_06970 [Natrialbaceae archaeon A-CW1-1]